MFFGPLAHLTRLAGGMTPFDIRPWGYSYAEARAFLEAIGEQGRAYYASPELILDAFYPPLYAVSRGLALWWLTMPGRIGKAPVPLKARWTLIAVPILMASLDLIENGGIAVMLWTWPDLSNAVVDLTSFATQVKIIAGALTEILMAGLAIVWLVRLFARRCVRRRSEHLRPAAGTTSALTSKCDAMPAVALDAPGTCERAVRRGVRHARSN
jgi:hypothetical protein